ncbi:MAG: NUDIX domain-containing protein [Patescibacteria group bacterium]
MNKPIAKQFFYVSLKILLQNNKGQFLILKTPKATSEFKGYYDLAGGTIDSNELKTDFAKIIKREVTEEIGLKVRYKLQLHPLAISKYKFSSGRCRFYILFKAKYLDGDIKISKEHTKYCWKKLNKNNIKKLFHPSLEKLLKNYFSGNKHR